MVRGQALRKKPQELKEQKFLKAKVYLALGFQVQGPNPTP